MKEIKYDTTKTNIPQLFAPLGFQYIRFMPTYKHHVCESRVINMLINIAFISNLIYVCQGLEGLRYKLTFFFNQNRRSCRFKAHEKPFIQVMTQTQRAKHYTTIAKLTSFSFLKTSPDVDFCKQIFVTFHSHPLKKQKYNFKLIIISEKQNLFIKMLP